MIQLVIVNLYTRFEVFILNGCGDIFDEKSGEKKTNIGNNKQEKAHFQGILMRLSSYRSLDLKMIIFYRGYAQLILLHARLKNGCIMLYPSASVRPSVCKPFRFRVTPPTVYVRLS